MPKVSIVLPAYNGAEYIESAITSVLNQDYSDWELIVVDDCSTDTTPEIAKRYAAQDQRIKYHRNIQNIKLPASLNIGFSFATGDYLSWTSCDNEYLPHAISTLVRELVQNDQVGLVYSDMQIIDDNGAEISILPAGPGTDIILRNVVGACFMYRADLAHKVGQYNEQMFLCEDYEYWIRLALHCNIQPVPAVLYRYRTHKKSLSRQFEREVIEKGIAMQKNYYKYFIKSRTMAARFYAYLRSRDIYNPFRQFYLLVVLYFSPVVFVNEFYNIILGRLQRYAKT